MISAFTEPTQRSTHIAALPEVILPQFFENSAKPHGPAQTVLSEIAQSRVNPISIAVHLDVIEHASWLADGSKEFAVYSFDL